MANHQGNISAIRANSNLTEDSRVDTDFASIVDELKPVTISFSDKEQAILAVYDSLQEMRLENAMMEAQISHGYEIELGADLKALEDAKRSHLEARATYSLSNNIIKNVLQVDPLLKAIHLGANASPMERFLHPLVDQRDILSLIQTNLSRRLQSVNNDLILIRAQHLEITRRNKILSREIVRLGKQAEVTADKIEDPALKERLEVLRNKTKDEKRQYRIVKSLASGIIAGSGFDWAADDELRDLVLDNED